jgi:hypothetical protein
MRAFFILTIYLFYFFLPDQNETKIQAKISFTKICATAYVGNSAAEVHEKCELPVFRQETLGHVREKPAVGFRGGFFVSFFAAEKKKNIHKIKGGFKV